jgi:hypothetical protein
MSAVPSHAAAVAAIVRVTWLRLTRGKLLWIGALVSALPTVFAASARGWRDAPAWTFGIARLLFVVLPPLYVASAIGDDIDDRTSTYLWSRPLARWTVIAGKLLALAPLVAVLIAAGWYVAYDIVLARSSSAALIGALAAGAIAVSCTSAGIATLLPRHGMALSIVYVLVDLLVGELPTSLHGLSITHHVTVLAQIGPPYDGSSLIAIVVIPVVWLVLATRRINRLEA